jgi:RyR domain
MRSRSLVSALRRAITRGSSGALSVVQRALEACYVAAVGYVCAVALYPWVRARVPSWFRWFGAENSHLTIIVVFAVPGLYLIIRRWTGKRLIATGAPIVVVAVMVVSGLALGMSAYLRCANGQAAFFAPLAWTLELFLGNIQTFSQGACSSPPPPIALQLAELFCFGAVLTTASVAALTLFSSQLDRIAIWRARKLTVVVAADDNTIGMVRAIVSTIGSGETLVALADNAASGAGRKVRDLGAKVRFVDLTDAESVARLPLWNRIQRLYLLSEDPLQNLKIFMAIDAKIADGRNEQIRLPLIVRIDDPWQAEVWRRSFLADAGRRWVPDSIGQFEITAAKLVRHITARRTDEAALVPPKTVVLCGMHPLTYAIACEFAQLERDQELYQKPNVVRPDNVVIFALGADSFVRDHQTRQNRMAPDGEPMPLTVHDAEPTVDTVTEYLHGADPASHAVVLGKPSMSVLATRLAARFPDLRVYLATTATTSLIDFSIVGRLYNFPVSLQLDTEAPQDVWERAAELIHELYCAETDRTLPARRPWPELSDFYKQSNRRQVHNALWMVEAIAEHTWNSLESDPTGSLPTSFVGLEPLVQLSILGFAEQTVEQMIRAEHEDWRKYYKKHGWKYSKIRDDLRRRHDRLLPWEELVDQRPESRLDAYRSLASTLRNLRALGYRSVPKVVATKQLCPDHVG